MQFFIFKDTFPLFEGVGEKNVPLFFFLTF